MSVDKLGKQMYPGMLSEADKDYIPDPTHLFPVVIIRKITGKEIKEAFKGIFPVPSAESNTLRNDNIRSCNNYDNFNDVENDSAISMTDDIPDDPFIDDIDSDDSDLPDLSNIADEGDKKLEKKDRITDKKGINGQNKEEERPKPSNKKADKLKHIENGKIKQSTNEIVNGKQSEKDCDQNKNLDKNRIKNGKKVNDKGEHDNEKKENKTKSGLIENVNKSDSSMKLRDKEKVLPINKLRKSDKIASENGKGINTSSTSKDVLSSPSKYSSSKKSSKSSTESVKFNSNSIPSAELVVHELSSIVDSSTELKDNEKVPPLDDLGRSDIALSDINTSKNDKGTNSSSISKDSSSRCSKSSSPINSAKKSTDSVKLNSNPIQSEELNVNIISSIADSSTELKDTEKVPPLDDLETSDITKSDINASENDKGNNSNLTSKILSSQCSNSTSKSSSKLSTDNGKINSNPLQSVEPTGIVLSSIIDSSTKLKENEKEHSLNNIKISDKQSGNISDSSVKSNKSNPLQSVEPTGIVLSSIIDSSTKLKENEKNDSLNNFKMSDKQPGNISDSDSSLKSNKSSGNISDISAKSKDLSSVSSKSSPSKSSTKSSTEINRSMNSNLVSSAEPKISLLTYLAKTREVKKQKAISKEQKVLNSFQFSIPMFIKSEPEDITDTEEAPPLNSLPDDGEFTSQIDSDQETVDFKESIKNNYEDDDGSENRSSRKKVKKKSDSKDDKGKNKIKINKINGMQKRNSRDEEGTNNLDETDKTGICDSNDFDNNSKRKSLGKTDETRINDTNDEKDRNKRKRDQNNGMEKRNSREDKSKNNLDEIEKTGICDINDIIYKSKRNKEDINANQSKNSREEGNEKTAYQVKNKRSDNECEKEEKKRKRGSDTVQEKKKLKGNIDKMKGEIEKGSNSDSSPQIVKKSFPNLKRLIDIESKTNLKSENIIQKEVGELVSELAIKMIPTIAAVPTQEVEKSACLPATMISKSSSVNSATPNVQSSSMTQPLISPVDVAEKEKTSLVSFSALQSKEERIKALKKIAGMCKSIMKKHSLEEKLQNECEEIKRKIILVESKIFEIQQEEERRMEELDIIHTQLDDIEDEEKIAEYLEKMIDLTDCTEIRERKSNLEKEKRILASDQDKAENTLLEAKAERKREELEMASLKASLNSSSRSTSASSSPRPEMTDSSNNKQICLSSSFSHSANSPVASQVRAVSGSELQQIQQYQPSHTRQDQPQGVVAALGEHRLYEPQPGPSDHNQISCNEDMVLIPKSKFDLMQKDEMQRMMQIPVSSHMIQRQETIIKTYQTGMSSMGSIQQQQQMMAMHQGQGLIQQQDITQQSLIQASPSSIGPQQTTMIAVPQQQVSQQDLIQASPSSIGPQQTTMISVPQQQVSQQGLIQASPSSIGPKQTTMIAASQQQGSQGTSGQQSVIMVPPQQSTEGIVEQIGVVSQQKQQTAAINKPETALYPPQGFQPGPVSAILHQHHPSSNNNTQQTIMKQSSGQEMVTHYAKGSSMQPIKPPEQPRISTSQHAMIGQTKVSSPQHMMPSGQTKMSGPQHVGVPGQTTVSSPHHMVPSSQTKISGSQHVVVPGQTILSSPQHGMPSDQTRMSGPQHRGMQGQPQVSSPQHEMPLGQNRMSGSQHRVMPGQPQVSSPQHGMPSGQTRMSGPQHRVMPGQPQVSSPQHGMPSGQTRMSGPQHHVKSGQPQVSSSQHGMPSGQTRMSGPQHCVMPAQTKLTSPQHVIPTGQARLSGTQHVAIPGQDKISSPQHVIPTGQGSPGQARLIGPQHMAMPSQDKITSPQLVGSLRPPPSYSEALTQVTPVASSQSPADQQQNKISNSMSTNSMLSQMLQTPITTQANPRTSRTEPISKKPGSHNHLQVQALQTQQTIMNDQRQRRLMSEGKTDSTSEYSGIGCRTPGCDGKGNTDPRRINHISTLYCPRAPSKKTTQPPLKVDNASTVPCPTSSSAIDFAMMMAPNQTTTDVNMTDASTAPQVSDSNLPTCFRCGKHGEFTCCGDTIYCGVDCQEADFDRHQVECKNVNEDYV